jgi:hypothetical protein
VIDPQEWTRSLLTDVPVEKLYPKITQTKALAAVFNAASLPGSSDALRFGALDDALYGGMATLSKAFEAYVTNNPALWAKTGIYLPQLLSGELTWLYLCAAVDAASLLTPEPLFLFANNTLKQCTNRHQLL